jgi:anthraniloyl-CoA monooxygenase
MPGISVAVLGGGPAGLVAARILRLRQPSWTVTVFERQPADSTFGYGVGLSYSSLDLLRAADQELTDALEAAAVSVGTWTVRRDGESISAKNAHGLGISRATLLRVLQQHAAAAGADVRMGHSAGLRDVTGADIVLACDGAGSETRSALAAELGATVSHGELAYLWCGADLPLTEMTLALRRTPDGPLTAHVMPYSAGACTFQVDAHRDAVAAWGTGADSLALLQREFADLLDGTALHVKRAEWATFATVSCERWHHGNVVLAGDAAHTAHYTVGYGTALAVEDAIELAESLSAVNGDTAAFDTYEAARRAKVSRLQRRADRSQRWWTTLGMRFDLPLPQLLLSYLTRTGAITLPAAKAQNPDLVAQCQALMNGGVPDRLVRAADVRPSAMATIVHESGRPTLDQVRSRVRQARDLASRGVSHVLVTGPPDREAVLDRLEIAEGLRCQAGVTAIVASPANLRDDLELAILCGRTDLAELS